MTYDESLPTQKDEVRFLVGDTTPSNEALTDNEIGYLLDQEGNVEMAAARAARAIAATVAKEPSFAFGTFEMSQSEAYSHFMDLAERLEGRASSGSQIGPPELARTPDDSNEFTEDFERGKFDIDSLDRS